LNIRIDIGFIVTPKQVQHNGVVSFSIFLSRHPELVSGSMGGGADSVDAETSPA
jgi:hypothetical protein